MLTCAFLTIDFASYPNSKFGNVRSNMDVTPLAANAAPAPAMTQPLVKTTPTTAPPAIKSPTSNGGCSGVTAWSPATVYHKGKKALYGVSLAPPPSLKVYLCTLVRGSHLEGQTVGSHLVLSVCYTDFIPLRIAGQRVMSQEVKVEADLAC